MVIYSSFNIILIFLLYTQKLLIISLSIHILTIIDCIFKLESILKMSVNASKVLL